MLCPSTPAAPPLARTFPRPPPALGRTHLVHQTVPTSSFDAVDQRRHHALRPDRGFHPRPVVGFCTLCSPSGHCRCCRLLLSVLHASTFLPAFPRPGFASRASRGLRRRGTMRALTPAGLARARQVSPLTPLCLPDIPPPTTSCARTSLFQSPQRVRQVPGFAMNRRLAATSAESGSSSCGLSVRLRLLPTPPRGDAVTFGYIGCDFPWQDFHLADKASSRTHSFRHGMPESRVHGRRCCPACWTPAQIRRERIWTRAARGEARTAGRGEHSLPRWNHIDLTTTSEQHRTLPGPCLRAAEN